MIWPGWRSGLLLAALLAALPMPLAAAEAQHSSPEVVFLGEVILLLVCGRLLGEAMQRIGQPAIMGQLLAGVLLGPSILGALAPDLQHALFPGNKEQSNMIGALSTRAISNRRPADTRLMPRSYLCAC